MTQVRGVIFDVDGMLVDSNDAHTHAWVEAMAELGYHVSFETQKRHQKARDIPSSDWAASRRDHYR